MNFLIEYEHATFGLRDARWFGSVNFLSGARSWSTRTIRPGS